MHSIYRISSSRSRQLLLVSVLTVSLCIAPHTLNAQYAQLIVFLPLVVNGFPVTASSANWQLNTQEQQIETLFRNDSEQHRQNPTRNDILAQVARARAQDMAQRNYFSHTNPDGHQPNFMVEEAGYSLPDCYPDNSNNIESIGLNYTAAVDSWQAWKDSPAHRVHVLGEDPFYADQTDYGIGYAENATSKYWVLITARH